jgi:hypothetical protein
MWAKVKHNLKRKRFANADELFAAVSREWNPVFLDIVNNLYTGFPARCKVCIELAGHCLNQHWKRVHELHHQGEGDDAQ